MTPPESDGPEKLDQLLQEWQPRAGSSTVESEHLSAKVRERARTSRLRRSVAAVGAVAALLAALVYFGPLTPAPAARTPEQMAVVQDLQLLSRNGDLIEHLDFLSLPDPPPHVQSRAVED